jgi:predicted permease
MSNPAFWRRLLRLPGRDARGVVDDELRFHLAMRSEELLARGMTPDEARLTAEKEFGELRAIRDACVTIEQRRTRNLLLREVTMDFFHDLRFGVRSLRNSPGFAMAAILCVGLGIGVTTTIFSAVHATLIRPLPFERPDELVVVYSSIPQKNWHGINISYADYLSWKERNRSLSQLGMWTWTSVTLTGGMDAERVDGARVTPNLFPLLGVRPILGRGFRAEEDREGDDRVILLSHALWRRRYAGDSTIVGRTIPVNGLQFTVVGVMPEHFAFPDQGQVWVPLAGDPQENRGNRYFAGAIGRLAPGVTLGRAQRDMAAVASALEREFPEENALWTTDVTPLRDDLVGDLERPLLVFSGAVFFVLLIACSNVANLLLARSASRQREIAVRTALGAGRGRLVRQLLTESVLIAALGGALGVGASAYGVRLLRHSFPAEVPYYLPIGLNLPTLAFAALVTMATGVLFGILPAMRAAGEDASSWLRDGTRGTGGAARSRVRNALIVAEVALSLVLMTGAGLLIKSYRSLESTDLGFQETGVL